MGTSGGMGTPKRLASYAVQRGGGTSITQDAPIKNTGGFDLAF
jgi:hypothetical protein